jgi:fumarylacetoacetase
MSWVEVEADSDFPIQNIPFGVFSTASTPPRVGTAIGKFVLDLSELYTAGLFNGVALPTNVFASSTLNAFMSLSRPVWRATRARIIALLSNGEGAEDDTDPSLRSNALLRERALVPMCDVSMHLPASIGDYTDFYCSREHATNCGVMFRGAENALQPNWLHLPVGYHGRASSVVVSGTPVHRPWGQVVDRSNTDPNAGSIFSQCKALDFELEVGFFLGGQPNPLGRPIKMADAEERIFGLVLLNDWSARDIQAWEYVPLGPFTAKNFCTSISPWVVTLDALEPFRCQTSAGPAQSDPAPLPYLVDPAYHCSAYDVKLQVSLGVGAGSDTGSDTGSGSGSGTDAGALSPLSLSNLQYLYWNLKQMLVHHSITGCPFAAGDLIGSGTISGPESSMYGSLMELSWKGSRDIVLREGRWVIRETDSAGVGATGTGTDADAGTGAGVPSSPLPTRKYLQDGDTVRMAGYAQGEGYRVGFGEVLGTILPAISDPY